MLATLQKLKCNICRPDIESFYDDSFNVVEMTQRLIEMAAGNPQGSKALVSGRVIILRDGVINSSTWFEA